MQQKKRPPAAMRAKKRMAAGVPGRPEHEPTPETRRKVSVAYAGGMSHADIAIVIGVTQPTLRKHYRHELNEGVLHRRIELMEAIFKAGMRGNVSAAKTFLTGERVLPGEAAPSDVAKAAAAQKAIERAERQTRGPAPRRLGKKEEAAAAAVTAHVGTDWDDLLAPPPTGTPLQ